MVDREIVEEPVHVLFSGQAEQTPEQPAIEWNGEVWSYRAIDDLSDALALQLRRAGVDREDRVAVCLDPSPAIVVAELAALKAGAAFVPIDPAYPPDRIDYLVADSSAAVLITAPGGRSVAVAPQAEPGHQPQRIELDLRRLTSGEPSTAAAIPPNGAACVIYTSGSTGRPKGVVITHRNLVHLARCATRRFELAPGERFLQMASVSFSAFLEEVFPSLLCGATVVLAGSASALTSTRSFLEVLRRRRITGFGITTALWHGLVEDLAADGDRFPPSLRFVLMGGEAARPDRVRQWATTGVPLVHVYGPTEATATATYLHTGEYRLGADGDWTLPLGTVIAQTQLHLLDEEMRPVPNGSTGEVYIAGVPVTRGYLGRPGETARRFLPDPFGAPGSRMYRTGDVGRLRPDGTYEFRGRVDEQFKINGYRIEPTEVEAAIERHPQIRRACVVAAADGAGDLRMTAYVVMQPGRTVDAGQLRDHTAASLPEFMLPHFWVSIDALPLTPNGKVDRQALARRPHAGTDTALADPVEHVVAEICAAVLGVPQVGADDDFFDLGGDSLKVARVIARTRRKLGVELPPRAVFDNRTVRGVAACVRELGAAGQSRDLEVPARRRRELVSQLLRTHTGVVGASPLSAGQRGLWYLHELMDTSPVYNAPWWCRLNGPLDSDTFAAALAGVVRRHDVLRARFRTADGVPIMVTEPDAEADYEFVDLSAVEPAERESAAFAFAHAEAARRMNLRSEVLRVRLIRLAAEDHLLVINAHHLVFDSTSSEILLAELDALCHRRTLPEAGQYADFAAWQEEWLRGTTRARLLGYWKEKLAGAPPLSLPVDRDVVGDLDRPAAVLRAALPVGVRSRLAELAPDAATTRFMVLFAIFLLVLHRRTDQDDLSVATPVSYRPLPAHEHIVGYFVNTLVLRCDLSGDPSFRELVGRVRSVCLDAYEHQDLPLDVLVEELGRDAVPQIRATFSVDRAPGADAVVASARVTDGREITTGRARFDLVWLVEETGGDGLRLAVDYDSERFTEATIRALLHDFTTLIEAVTAAPDKPLSLLPAPEPAPGIPLPEMTRQLCELFAQVFDVERVTPQDDFFELGGYSALAAELTARIGERYRVDLPLRVFFDEPTVAGIAAKIHQNAVPGGDRAERGEPGLESLLQQIETLSDEEIEAVLRGNSGG